MKLNDFEDCSGPYIYMGLTNAKDSSHMDNNKASHRRRVIFYHTKKFNHMQCKQNSCSALLWNNFHKPPDFVIYEVFAIG